MQILILRVVKGSHFYRKSVPLTEKEAESVARKKVSMQNYCQRFPFRAPRPQGKSRWRIAGRFVLQIKRPHLRLSKPNFFAVGKFCVILFSSLIIFSIQMGKTLHFYTDFKNLWV